MKQHIYHETSGFDVYLGKVKRFGQHNDGADLLLPDHTPEVVDRLLGWTLSYDVGIWFQKALCKCNMNMGIMKKKHIKIVSAIR